MKILCIGNSAYDTILKLTHFPKENTKQTIEKKIQCPGGRAQTVSLLLNEYNLDVTLITELGQDYYGSIMLENLKRKNINTNYIFKTDVTNTNTILTSNNNRTVLRESNPSSINVNINNCEYDIIYTDGKYHEISKEIFLKSKNKLTILDMENLKEETLTLANLATYTICSKTIIEENNYQKMYEKLKEKIKSKLIITLGEDGAIYNQQIISAPKVNAIDVTSAGDIFVGTFIYAKSKNQNDIDAIKLGTHIASLSTQKEGSSISIPRLEEVESYEFK